MKHVHAGSERLDLLLAAEKHFAIIRILAQLQGHGAGLACIQRSYTIVAFGHSMGTLECDADVRSINEEVKHVPNKEIEDGRGGTALSDSRVELLV